MPDKQLPRIRGRPSRHANCGRKTVKLRNTGATSWCCSLHSRRSAACRPWRRKTDRHPQRAKCSQRICRARSARPSALMAPSTSPKAEPAETRRSRPPTATAISASPAASRASTRRPASARRSQRYRLRGGESRRPGLRPRRHRLPQRRALLPHHRLVQSDRGSRGVPQRHLPHQQGRLFETRRQHQQVQRRQPCRVRGRRPRRQSVRASRLRNGELLRHRRQLQPRAAHHDRGKISIVVVVRERRDDGHRRPRRRPTRSSPNSAAFPFEPSSGQGDPGRRPHGHADRTRQRLQPHHQRRLRPGRPSSTHCRWATRLRRKAAMRRCRSPARSCASTPMAPSRPSSMDSCSRLRSISAATQPTSHRSIGQVYQIDDFSSIEPIEPTPTAAPPTPVPPAKPVGITAPNTGGGPANTSGSMAWVIAIAAITLGALATAGGVAAKRR